MKCLGRILACAALGAGLLGAKAAPVIEGETLLAVRVFPLLQAKCLPCHGDDQDKLKGSLESNGDGTG